MSTLHLLDQALALTPTPDAAPGTLAGHTHPAYWNMVGPYGGITAAVMLQAVMQQPDRLGEPLALTVNFAGALLPGPFTVRAVAERTNRSTQHWVVSLSQVDASGQRLVMTTATVVTAVRRDTWAAQDALPPRVQPASALPRADRSASGVAWLDRYDFRVVEGDIPQRWDGQEQGHSRTCMWVRDEPPRPLDAVSLAALADVFFPRIWLRRATRVPVGTVSMTVYFMGSTQQLAATGSRHLLLQAQGQGFEQGFFDHCGQLWSDTGALLATTHQVVYFKA